jgi:hypothetical protein
MAMPSTQELEKDWRQPFRYTGIEGDQFDFPKIPVEVKGRTTYHDPLISGEERTRLTQEASGRYQEIQSSAASDPLDYATATKSTFDLPDISGVEETITRYGKSVDVSRGAKGRFAKKIEGMVTKTQEESVFQKVGETIKAILAERYDRLPIGESGGDQSGTLRQAVSNSEVTFKRQPGRVTEISVELADYMRPPRPNEMAGVKTREYGKFVFGGRRAFSQRGRPLRFRIHDSWLTAKNVRASRTDLKVYELDPDEKAKVKQVYFESVVAAIKENQ